VFLEVEAEPATGEAAVAVRLFAGDQCRQLERLGDRDAGDLGRGSPRRARGCHVPAPAGRSFEVALRGRRSSSLGPAAGPSLAAAGVWSTA
jgi:hypothetical protein